MESVDGSDSDSDNAEGHNIDGFNSVYDYWTFKAEKYVRDFPWLYYNFVDSGYKCKTCEMFPPLTLGGGNSKDKFIREAVKCLSDHPRRQLMVHQNSNKHVLATKQFEGKVIDTSWNTTEYGPVYGKYVVQIRGRIWYYFTLSNSCIYEEGHQVNDLVMIIG